MDQMKFAQKIKEARKAKGMTQKELAEKLQVTDKAVSKWERALSFPDIELLVIMKERMQEELRRRKRWLMMTMALFLTLSVLLGIYEIYAVATIRTQMNAYEESAYTLSY